MTPPLGPPSRIMMLSHHMPCVFWNYLRHRGGSSTGRLQSSEPRVAEGWCLSWLAWGPLTALPCPWPRPLPVEKVWTSQREKLSPGDQQGSHGIGNGNSPLPVLAFHVTTQTAAKELSPFNLRCCPEWLATTGPGRTVTIHSANVGREPAVCRTPFPVLGTQQKTKTTEACLRGPFVPVPVETF